MSTHYTLDMLPLPGTDDFGTQWEAYRAIWKGNLRVIDGLRMSGLPFDSGLRMQLDSLRFDCAEAIAVIDKHVRLGGMRADLALEISGMQDALDAYLRSLLTAKRMWNAWVQGTDRVLVPSDFEGIGSTEEELVQLSKPEETKTTVTILLGGTVLLGLIWLLKG